MARVRALLPLDGGGAERSEGVKLDDMQRYFTPPGRFAATLPIEGREWRAALHR
jgi:hypothetical protein